jgi:transcription termination/antitermination protein NusG
MLIEEPPDDRTDTPDDPVEETVEPPPAEEPSAPPSPASEDSAEEPVGPSEPEQPSAPASPASEEGSPAEPVGPSPVTRGVPSDGPPGPSDDTAESTGSAEASPEGAPLATEGEADATSADEGGAGATEEEGDDEAPAAAAAEGNGQVEAEAELAAADPFGGPGDWYVIHTYAGYENKVKTNLESRIHTMQMEEKIFDVHVPMEDVMEIKGGKKQVVQKKVFPGYLLVRMVYDDDSWYVVRNTPGVTGFVSSGTGQKPTPLSRREVEKILAVKEEEAKKPAFRLEFEEGDVVRIISGPFADFNGTISDINVDQSKLRVMVNIFDRETPVELGFDQVAKV